MNTSFFARPLQVVALAFTGIALLAAPQPSFAIATATPGPASSPVPTSAPLAHSLPYASNLDFTLDQTVSSAHVTDGQLIPISLMKPILIDGIMVADKGAHAALRVINQRHAASGDVQGFVDVEVTSLTLADGQILPLLNDRSHLSNRDTRGHESTVGVEDTVGSMTLPFYSIFAALRRGREITVPAGTKIAVRTAATLTLNSRGNPVISLPSPPPVALSTPASSFPVAPLYTATPAPTPRPTPTPSPTPLASP